MLVFDPKTEQITVTQMAGQTEKKATLQRITFGNGTFVVGGQDGLLASSTDGIHWKNNKTFPERGEVSSVIWTGSLFLASARNGALSSRDGLNWEPVKGKIPRKMVRAGEWLYGWSWPPHKIQRSQEGLNWKPVPNEKQFYLKHVAFGELVGKGAPPKVPPAPQRRKKK